MNTNPLETALALLSELEIEVVDVCALPHCEICRPVLDVAA